MQKVLCECGVYQYFGFEIPNHRELGLDEQEIYSVLKNGDFVNSLYKGIAGKKIPLYLGSPFSESPVGFVDKFDFFDGILFANIDNLTNLEFSAGYLVDAKKEGGDYMGIPYDIVMLDPVLKNITLVERKKERVKFIC